MARFTQLSVFTKVVESGSFVGAARALDIAPATVTAHVQALERRLKTKLLQRTTRRVSLTEEGAAYYAHCGEILGRMEEADAMLAARRTSPHGTLRVAMPPLLGTLIVVPGLPAFLRRHPQLRVELTLDARAPDLVAQNLDLSLQVDVDHDPGLVFRPLGLCRVRTLASPAYLRRRGVPRTPDDLERHEIIGVRPMPGVMLSTLHFQKDGRVFTRDIQGRLVVEPGDAQRAAALAGSGIMQGFHYAVADLIESGRLVPVLRDWEWSGPPLGALHLPNRFLLPKAGVFLDFLGKQLAGKVEPYRPDWDNRQ
jgi:DNA-binding transcriptional LysR family regulator